MDSAVLYGLSRALWTQPVFNGLSPCLMDSARVMARLSRVMARLSRVMARTDTIPTSVMPELTDFSQNGRPSAEM